MDILNIENCTIRYQEQEAAVEHVSLSVGEQEIVSIVGESGSGKTTLAVKLLELNEIKGFLSNDRVFVNENLQMDYFPQAVTYAMGTVKNNNRLNQYFIDNKILEKRKKIN